MVESPLKVVVVVVVVVDLQWALPPQQSNNDKNGEWTFGKRDKCRRDCSKEVEENENPCTAPLVAKLNVENEIKMVDTTTSRMMAMVTI